MPTICIPAGNFLGLPVDYNVTYDSFVNPDGSSYGKVDIYQALGCTSIFFLKSIPWTSNVSGTTHHAVISINTSGGIGEAVLAYLTRGFVPAFVASMNFLGYSGTTTVNSITVRGDDIVIDVNFSSPLIKLAIIAVILALLDILVYLVVKGIEALGDKFITPLVPGLNALFIALAVGGVIMAGTVAYSFASSAEGRAQVRSGTSRAVRYGARAGSRAVGYGVRSGRKYLPRAAGVASRGYSGLRASLRRK